MPTCGGYFTCDFGGQSERRPGVGRGKGRGFTKPPLRRGRKRR